MKVKDEFERKDKRLPLSLPFEEEKE